MKSQKQTTIRVISLLFLLFGIALSQDNAFEDWDPHLETGDRTYNAAIGISPWWGTVGLTLNPGMEFIFNEIRIGESVPLSFGVAGRGNVTTYLDYGANSLGVSVAALGTTHLGFKNVSEPFEWLENFDVYLGIGLGFDIIQPGWYNLSRFRIASIQGTNYFIRDNFAVYVENAYLGRYRGALTFGVLWKV
ncbi:hypothetical protein QA601_03540 [Chitinispirillales bacterium ANBcel5]|uniref:hypothetical protein n=1 Tax=Cellulosispirillum alkaliphilum TaxID=3039283 RepID=UPI002A53F8DB|nr:hypothetical protein [Chitinispirillales bacterium ANBcel5]